MVGGRLLPPDDRCPKWLTSGRFKLAMETHMTAICDARLIYGRGWVSRVFICRAALRNIYFNSPLE